MTPVNELFLSILRSALRSEQAAPCPELSAEQWQTLLQMAAEHKVLPLFYEALHPQIRSADEGLCAANKRIVRNQVILQALRTGDFLDVYHRLLDAGITPLVVKGIVCRELYAKPDHRPSADEDLLVPPDQFDLCRRVLEEYGMFTTEVNTDSAYELPYRKADSPLFIELHRSLFPPESEAYGDLNAFFPDPFRSAVSVEAQGQQILTMHPTDHMTYLLFHAFKHFLHSGFGIRQICDILLFSRHYDSQIDWPQVRRSCRSIRAEKFAAALFRIGANHLGFEPVAEWSLETVDEAPLLEDILHAGIYGNTDSNRLHSSSITLDAVASGKQDRRAKNAILVSAFPPAKNLTNRYPWLKQHPYLLPAAWAFRLGGYLREISSRRDNSAAAALKIGTERVALLKYYDILN